MGTRLARAGVSFTRATGSAAGAGAAAGSGVAAWAAFAPLRAISSPAVAMRPISSTSDSKCLRTASLSGRSGYLTIASRRNSSVRF